MRRLRRALAAAATALLALTTVPAGAVDTAGGIDADADSVVNNAGAYLDITSPTGARYACTGTLITKIHVLTAKHCVHNVNKDEDLLASATAHIGLDRHAPVDRLQVTDVELAPAADLAVLTLHQPATAEPAKVWGGDVDLEDETFVASGFGNGPGGEPLPRMGEAYIDVAGRSPYTLERTDDTVQEGYFGAPQDSFRQITRITQGDSGGPLHNYDYVLGVTSAAENEAPYEMLFVPTRDHSVWIDAVAPGSVEGMPEIIPGVPLPQKLTDAMPTVSSLPSLTSLFRGEPLFAPATKTQTGIELE